MNDPQKMSPRDLESLLQDLEDGTATIEQRDTLMDLLESSPETRRAYCDHMLLSSALHSESFDREKLSELKEFGIARNFNSRRQVRYAVAAAAALIALVGVVLSLVAVKPLPMATADASIGAKWSFEAGGISRDRDFIKDSRLTVEHGTVQLEFSSGTRAFVTAPATMLIRNRLEVDLVEGRAWFEIAKGDEEFSVTTKTLVAVDLGTKFGVEALANHSEVHVLKGRVRVESRLPRQPSWELGSGEAVGSDAVGFISATAFDREKFPKGIEVTKRLAYWSFDGERPMEAATSQGERATLSVTALKGEATEQFVGGVQGEALDLSQKGVYAVSGYACPLGSSPRTVTFWIRKPDGDVVDGEAHGWRHPPLLGWGDLGTALAKWYVSTDNSGELIGSNWGSAWKVSDLEKGRSIYDGDWHHIAVVFTGEEIAGDPEIIHYLNGQRIPINIQSDAAPVRTRPSPDRDRQLLIGYYEFDGYRPGTLPIQIDELVIADYVLPEEMLLRLAKGDPTDLPSK